MSDTHDDVASERQRWVEKTYEPSRRRTAERREHFETLSGIPLQPIYDSSDAPSQSFLDDVGFTV